MKKKVYFHTINIDKKTMGIKTFYLTKGKIRIMLGFKSGSWENQGNSAVSLTFLFLLSN